jgi:hypothetical protein
VRNWHRQHQSKTLTPSRTKASLGGSNHFPLALCTFLSYLMILHCAIGHRNCIEALVEKDTFRSILDDPMARDGSLAMARRSYMLW